MAVRRAIHSPTGPSQIILAQMRPLPRSKAVAIETKVPEPYSLIITNKDSSLLSQQDTCSRLYLNEIAERQTFVWFLRICITFEHLWKGDSGKNRGKWEENRRR